MENKTEELLNYLEGFITENRKEGFLRVLKNRTRHFTVAMEDVYQLHNTSAVMRSCEVFGIQELNVIEQKFGKRIDTEIAMGAQKWVDVNRFNSVQSCIDEMKFKGYQIIATTPHNDSCLLHEFDITKPAALFFGTERDGLSDEVMQQDPAAYQPGGLGGIFTPDLVGATNANFFNQRQINWDSMYLANSIPLT